MITAIIIMAVILAAIVAISIIMFKYKQVIEEARDCLINEKQSLIELSNKISSSMKSDLDQLQVLSTELKSSLKTTVDNKIESVGEAEVDILKEAGFNKTQPPDESSENE